MRKHEGHEGYGRGARAMVGGMRVSSPLDPDTELVMTRTIGAALAVHKALGPGFLESIYRKAMCIELDSCAIPFERERPIRVRYRNAEIPGQRVDLVVADLRAFRVLRVETFVVMTTVPQP